MKELDELRNAIYEFYSKHEIRITDIGVAWLDLSTASERCFRIEDININYTIKAYDRKHPEEPIRRKGFAETR